MITTTRIESDSLEQLRKMAIAHRRSMTKELAVIMDAAIQPPKSFDTPSTNQQMTDIKPEDIPKAWQPKSSATFAPRKPLPKK